jgi:molybdenum cofactor cytidylyltransferase
MNFGPVPLDQAEGKILGHHIAGPSGRRAFRKGRPLTAEDIQALCELGREIVYVAELEADDVDEDTAALRVADAVKGSGLCVSKAHVGRVNLEATEFGLLRVDAGRLTRLNESEGVTLATLETNSIVTAGKTVATVKVIPFAVPEAEVTRAEAIAAEGPVAMIGLQELLPRSVAVVLSGSPSVEQRVMENFERPLRERVEALGSEIRSVDYISLEDQQGESALADVLIRRVNDGANLILLAGETAIMDRYDIAPRAIERAGGEVTCFGAPVDPGNLLMLAYLQDVPILGAPGCARSPKVNVIDWVLPRLLAGDRLARMDILALGHGGLLEDTPLRPMPRSALS